MNYTFRKAESKDSDRINQLFVEMMQTIRATNQVKGYPDGYLNKFFVGASIKIQTTAI